MRTGEDHVTWYVCAARLESGEVLDLWAWGQPLSWDVPERAPRTGRWKSFAAVAFAGPSDRGRRPSGGPSWLYGPAVETMGDAGLDRPPAQGAIHVWRYLCREWTRLQPHRAPVAHFKFFILAAPIITDDEDTSPESPSVQANASRASRQHPWRPAYGAPKKRLLAAFDCSD